MPKMAKTNSNSDTVQSKPQYIEKSKRCNRENRHYHKQSQFQHLETTPMPVSQSIPCLEKKPDFQRLIKG